MTRPPERCSTSRLPPASRWCRSCSACCCWWPSSGRRTLPPRPAAQQADRYVSVRHLAALKTFEQSVVRRRAPTTAAAPTAGGLPAGGSCRSAAATGTPAGTSRGAAIAAQLGALDAMLLRFSTRANTRVDAAVGLRCNPLVRRRRQRARNAVRSARVPAAALPGRMRRPRGRVDRADSLGRPHAGGAGLARHRGRSGRRALASRADDGGVDPRGGAPQPVERRGRMHLPRQARHGRRADALRRRRAQCAGAPVRAARDVGRIGGRCARARRVRSRARRPTCRSPTIALARAAVAAGDAAAARRPAPAVRRAVPAVHRCGTPRRPTLPTAYRFGPNRIVLDGAPVDVGFSIDLTIDPSLQALAQKTAACYTRPARRLPRARHPARRGRGAARIGHRLLEGAMVRMAAVAVVDVASGRIEALAGALSPCARQEVDGPGRGANCDRRLPYPVQYRPGRAAEPGRVPRRDARIDDQADHGGRLPRRPRRRRALVGGRARRDEARRAPRARQPARPADALGLGAFPRPHVLLRQGLRRLRTALGRAGRGARLRLERRLRRSARVDCGKHDLLFGRAVDATAEAGAVRPLATTVAYGRADERAGRRQARRAAAADAARGAGSAPSCAAARSAPTAGAAATTTGRSAAAARSSTWSPKAGGKAMRASSALGVAGMMATLAAAANGQAEVRRPHLVRIAARRRRGRRGDAAIGGRALEPRCRRNRTALSRDAAEVILDGLSYSHRAGTSRTACEQVFDAQDLPRHDWIAGKTGTPSFPSDGLSLDDLARLCGTGNAATRGSHAACGSLRPYKWYVAAYRDRSEGRPVDQGHRRADRAQLARPERTRARRRRPRPQPGGRDRDADRRPAAWTHPGSGAMRTARAAAGGRPLPSPLVWTFDGPFDRCLADAEDTLRRAIVHGRRRVARRAAGRPVAAGAAAARAGRRRRAAGLGPLPRNIERYGLPAAPRVRHLRGDGPLLTLLVAYRN